VNEEMLQGFGYYLTINLMSSQFTGNDVYTGVCFDGDQIHNWYIGPNPKAVCQICGNRIATQKLISGEEWWTQNQEPKQSRNTQPGTQPAQA